MDIVEAFGHFNTWSIHQGLTSCFQLSDQLFCTFFCRITLNKIDCLLIFFYISSIERVVNQATGVSTLSVLKAQVVIFELSDQAFQVTNRVVHIDCLISIPRINSRLTSIPPTLRIAKGRTPHVRNRTVFIRNARTRNITFIKRTQRQRITISRIYLTRTPFPSLNLSAIRKDVCIRQKLVTAGSFPFCQRKRLIRLSVSRHFHLHASPQAGLTDN